MVDATIMMTRRIGSQRAACAYRSRKILLITRLLFVAKSAAAFRPPSIRDELGCSPTLSVIFGRSGDASAGAVFFDPLRIANDDNFPRLRECELKCGRICMLAVVETVLVPLLRRAKSFDGLIHVPEGGKVWDRIAHLTLADAAKVLVACAILETTVFVQRSPRDLPGDYGTGWFGLRDPGRHESLLVAELEHGRLAMLALAAQLALERWLDRSWDEYWMEAIKNWLDRS
jgi:hypothetical protein